MITKAIKAAILGPQNIRDDIPARTFIVKNIDDKYASKLLKGLDSYLRREQINFNEYRLSDLKQDITTLSKQRGVGQVSINHLREAIDRYEN